MSAALISRDPHLKRLVDEGFELELRETILLVHSVPYVKTDQSLARGTMVCSLSIDTQSLTSTPQDDHTMYFIGETPCNRDGTPMTSIINNSNKATIGDGIDVDHYFSSKPEEEPHKYANIYDKVVTYESHLGGAARSHDRAANARTFNPAIDAGDDSPFAIPDSASPRYGTVSTNKKLKGRIAFIGLGGTGAHALDIATKSRVSEIHLYDGDQLLNHNLFRAPGAPVPKLLKGFPSKVDYYAAVYGNMHKHVIAHPEYVTSANVDELAGFDFVFVCVDKGSARRAIAEGLVRLGVPFVDCGIGVGLEEDMLDGCARVTFIEPGTPWADVEKVLPFGDDVGANDDDVYHTAIQIAEVNAFNAVMAIMRWKRWLTFFRDERGEQTATYMIEGNLISNRSR